jgi:uncharacterized protein (TIGR02145 family)
MINILMKAPLLFYTMFLIAGFSIHAQSTMNIFQNNGNIFQIAVNEIDSITYTTNDSGNLTTVSTLPIGNITSNSATGGGSINTTDIGSILQRGLCWNTSQNPTTANFITNEGAEIGSFNSNLTGLMANTLYYVRAYAITSEGTAYGNQVSFTTVNPITDIVSNPGEGIIYNGFNYTSVILGNGQEWMSENLQTNSYRNGDPIPTGLDSTNWIMTTSGAYVVYNNDSSNNTVYGKLYNWYAVADERHLCPTGWHEPSAGEWVTLIDYLGGFTIAGGKMKALGIEYWNSPNQDATNESGFSALPGGSLDPIGTFNNLGLWGNWWSKSEYAANYSSSCFLNNNGGDVDFGSPMKQHGLSVRCIKD